MSSGHLENFIRAQAYPNKLVLSAMFGQSLDAQIRKGEKRNQIRSNRFRFQGADCRCTYQSGAEPELALKDARISRDPTPTIIVSANRSKIVDSEH